MPGRTLATWYGMFLKVPEVPPGLGGSEAANNAYPELPPYSRHHAASPFDQTHYSGSGYGYYPVNQGGSTPSYSGSEQRPYPPPSPSYQQHYSPSPSPVASPYHYAEQSGSSPASQQQVAAHMSFSGNQQQQQGAYSSAAAPAQAATHYAANNHRHSGQHSYPAPTTTQHQQWGGSYAPSPGQSPVMGSPSPARSNNPPLSPAPQASMSGQFSQGPPAQAQPTSGHWQGHQAHGHSMHQGSNQSMVANMSPPPQSLQSQAQYYQPPNPQAVSPQQLDLSCSSPHQPVDLHSPGPALHSPGPAGPWPRNPSGGGGGGSSPLASLQMLVNQDMNRQASAAAYPPNSQGMVDLSLPRGNTPHQSGKPEELRNGNTSATTSSPPALNGDLSSGADSGISSPMMTHLHPPDKPAGPRISVKSPQRLAAEAERQAARAQLRTTPSPQSPIAPEHNSALNLNKVQASIANRLQNPEPPSEPEGSPSPLPREARTKASMKRARKVDSILENLVESGTKKKRATTPPLVSEVLPPVICVPPSEDSGMEGSTSCPNSPNKVSRSRSPTSREDTVSPAFDDASQDSKPRRKRKPDNPTRLKTTEEGKTKTEGEGVATAAQLQPAVTAVAIDVDTPAPEEKVVSEPPQKSGNPTPLKKDNTQETSSAVDLSIKQVPDPTPEPKVDDISSAVSATEVTPPSPPANKTEPKTPFIEVENELAKMFEGIENEASPASGTNDSPSKEVSTDNEPKAGPSSSNPSTPSKGKRGRPKGKKELSDSAADTPTPTPKKQKKTKKDNKDGETPKAVKRKRSKSKVPLEDEFISELPSTSSKKKKKRKSDGKAVKGDGKKNAQDTPVRQQTPVVERCRGPYVRIEGPKDLPNNVSVFNSTRGDDEDGERPAASCALKYNRKKLSWHNERELRNRVQGLGFSSTMASHYDAFTADESWRCAFCKRGSHSDGLGDLFGPYFIQQEKTVAEQTAVQQTEEGKKSKSKKKRRKSTDETQKSSKKSKGQQSAAADATRGELAEPGPWEVWVHEPCAIWAAGVHLVGARMVGLQEAVWGAANSVCGDCGQSGANLGCVRRTCNERAHYNCARGLGWQLDEEGYISCCPAHKRSIPSSAGKST